MTAAMSRRAFLRGSIQTAGDRVSQHMCLAVGGVYCRSCADACPSSAIRIKPLLGGRADVVIDMECCEGCADCVDACPVGAIAEPTPRNSTERAHA